MYSTHKDNAVDWSFWHLRRSDITYLTHGYHKYPAKFIPQLVEKILIEYAPPEKLSCGSLSGLHINDPFMGSGTTIVVAITNGCAASGVDINPVAYLISKVKARALPPDTLKTDIKTFIEMVRGDRLDNIDCIYKFNNELREKLSSFFSNSNLITLCNLLSIIEKQEKEHIRDFLKVAFSDILKPCSYWSNRSIKPVKDRSKAIPPVLPTFLTKLKQMMNGNMDFYNLLISKGIDINSLSVNISIGSAKSQNLPDASVDMIVTSSPYVTSYEYAYLHQLSIMFLYPDFLNSKSNFIGTLNIGDKEPISRIQSLQSSLGISVTKDLYKKSKRFGNATAAFFLDMQDVIKDNWRILKQGARAAYVISDTVLGGISIPTTKIFIELFESVGFRHIDTIERKIISKMLPLSRDPSTGRFAANSTSSMQVYPVEYIIVFEK